MNTAKSALCVLACGAVILTAMPALAYTVTVYVEGVVTEIYTFDGLEFDGSVTVGSTMTGFVTYDTETPDQKPQYDWVACYSLASISMHVGSYTFTHNLGADEEPYFYISAGNGGFFYDIRSMDSAFYGPCYMNGQATNLEDLDLTGCGFGMYNLAANIASPTGDALPDENTFPALSVFDEDRLFLIESWLSPEFNIYGEVTSLTVVPEPASVLLFGLASLALLRKRRK